jgi:hypothetical protein
VTKAQKAASETAELFRAFFAAYDARSTHDRQLALRIREQVHRELYRREREQFPEWVDLGEGG